MRQPQFNNSQFVSESIFNSAFAQIFESITEMGNGPTFFIPGVVGSVALTFSASLNVGVNATNLKCLFGTGNFSGAHGTTTGVDSASYTVNFSSVVPSSGTTTAYLVATYTTVQLDPVVIVGPPPGHPDYSSVFVPYIAYTRIQDTLNIIATTTVPNNTTNIELARITLTAGQASITSADTSFQVPASINPVPVSMSGDISGKTNSSFISNLQGKPVSAAAPATNSFLQFNGTTWVPGSVAGAFPPNGPAGGDLTGTYPNPQAKKSTTSNFTANRLISLADITAVTNITANGDVIAGSGGNTGHLIGDDAAAANQAVILGQLAGQVTVSGPNTSGHFNIPLWTGATIQKVLVQFGSVQNGTGSPGWAPGTGLTVFFPLAFPAIPGIINLTGLCPAATGNPTILLGTPSTIGFQLQTGTGGNTGAFYWFAIGI